MPHRFLLPMVGIVLLCDLARAQDRAVGPGPELFQGTADSTQIRRSYAAGFMNASTIMLHRPPGQQLRLWRNASTMAPEDLFMPELLSRRFGVWLEVIDADTLSAGRLAYFESYNDAVEQELMREHGTTVLEELAVEARVQYRLYRQSRGLPEDSGPER